LTRLKRGPLSPRSRWVPHPASVSSNERSIHALDRWLRPRRRGRAVFSVLFSAAALAQGVTTGAVAGIAIDSASGAPLDGARVVAVHVPSGTTYARQRVLTAASRSRHARRRPISCDRVAGRVPAGSAERRHRDIGRDQRPPLRAETSGCRARSDHRPTTAAGGVFSSQHTGAATTVSTEALATCRRSVAGWRTCCGSRRNTARCRSASRSPARTTG